LQAPAHLPLSLHFWLHAGLSAAAALEVKSKPANVMPANNTNANAIIEIFLNIFILRKIIS
jgi:hypothetical protein